jgi:hypothetical protein
MPMFEQDTLPVSRRWHNRHPSDHAVQVAYGCTQIFCSNPDGLLLCGSGAWSDGSIGRSAAKLGAQHNHRLRTTFPTCIACPFMVNTSTLTEGLPGSSNAWLNAKTHAWIFLADIGYRC